MSIRVVQCMMIAGIVLAVGVRQADAQRIRRSQHGTVTQMIGATEVAVTYNRPVARGRALFGALVPWGEIWCPGADSATTIAVSTPVLVAGARLPAGTYSLWAIPREHEWTLIFSSAADVWHVPYPGADRDQLRVSLEPKQGAHMETLTFHFPVVDGPRGILAFHWGETIVEVPIEPAR